MVVFGFGSGKWGRAGEEERRSGEGKCSGLRRRTVSRAGERLQYESDLRIEQGYLVIAVLQLGQAVGHCWSI